MVLFCCSFRDFDLHRNRFQSVLVLFSYIFGAVIMLAVFYNISKVVRNTGAVSSHLIAFNYSHECNADGNESPKKPESKRLAEFRKKLRETTDIEDLGEQPDMHTSQKEEALPAWPDNTNPHTGEVGGPRGPEPTRYGDWERKGRVTDF